MQYLLNVLLFFYSQVLLTILLAILILPVSQLNVKYRIFNQLNI